MSHVMLVEGDNLSAEFYQTVLEHAEHQVERVSLAQEALDALDDRDFDCLVLDINLPGHNGIEILHELQSYQDWQQLPTIVITEVSKDKLKLSAKQWRNYGVHEVLYKPRLKPQHLVAAIEKACSVFKPTV